MKGTTRNAKSVVWVWVGAGHMGAGHAALHGSDQRLGSTVRGSGGGPALAYGRLVAPQVGRAAWATKFSNEKIQ